MKVLSRLMFKIYPAFGLYFNGAMRSFLLKVLAYAVVEWIRYLLHNLFPQVVYVALLPVRNSLISSSPNHMKLSRKKNSIGLVDIVFVWTVLNWEIPSTEASEKEITGSNAIGDVTYLKHKHFLEYIVLSFHVSTQDS